MKTIKFISILIVTLLFSSCVRDSDIFDIVESIDAPTNISADFFITQDNTGLVKITPNGEGVTQFEIYFEANSNYKLLKELNNIETIGPIMLGMRKAWVFIKWKGSFLQI